MPESDLTAELLALALVGLERHRSLELEAPESAPEFLRDVAQAVVPALAVTLKVPVAKHGTASIAGFGTFANGRRTTLVSNPRPS